MDFLFLIFFGYYIYEYKKNNHTAAWNTTVPDVLRTSLTHLNLALTSPAKLPVALSQNQQLSVSDVTKTSAHLETCVSTRLGGVNLLQLRRRTPVSAPTAKRSFLSNQLATFMFGGAVPQQCRVVQRLSSRRKSAA